MTRLQKVGIGAVVALVVLNIFAAGAVFGAFKWNEYKNRQSAKNDQVVQAALKSVQVAEVPKN